MIAWTSPLAISRSIPWRISCSGLASGATRRPRMMRRSSSVVGDGRCDGGGGGGLIGHGVIKAPCRSSTATRRWGTRSARVIESSAPAIASRTRTHRTLTVQRELRSHVEAVLGIVGRADHRRDRALQGAEDLAHPDVGRGTGQLVAAARAAGAGDEAGVAEAHDELLEVGPRQVLVGGDVRQAGRSGPEPTPELDHEPHAVLALRTEGDGARSMEGRAGRGGGQRLRQWTILNPE